VIEVDKPGYWKMHTGILIASIRDALDRSSQLVETGYPTSWWSNSSEADKSEDIPKLNSAERKIRNQDVLDQALSRDYLVLTPRTKQEVPPFLPNSPYMRFPPSIPLDAHTDEHRKSFIKIRVYPSFVPLISRGVLEIDKIPLEFPARHGTTKTVIIKNAHKKESMDKLEHEYRVYVDLANAGVSGIPRVIGFFRTVPPRSSAKCKLPYAALIMEDVGEPFTTNLNLGKVYRSEIQTILAAIHGAGYIHGGLALCNFMIHRVSKLGAAIVGFGDARAITDAEKEEENAIFSRIFPLKRKIEEVEVDPTEPPPYPKERWRDCI